MQQLSSAKFRTSYARLEVPTEVTVNGHVIGHWAPYIGTPVYHLDTTVRDQHLDLLNRLALRAGLRKG